MTVLKHKTPCKVCPMRRDSVKGWLGASTPQEFVDQINGEVDMPCHAAVDYECDDWESQLEDAPSCAGTLIFMKNQCKSPRDIRLKKRVKEVERDTDLVFSWNAEFINHHTRNTNEI